MVAKSYVAYYRVSTARQGVSGLGLEAQKEAVRRFIAGGGVLLQEVTEVETGKGFNALAKRPKLCSALEASRVHGATLVIAKLDRLSRNVRFIAELMESKVQFVACDMPEANALTLHVMAAFAQHEAKRISDRTKEALACAKARGVRLGRMGGQNLKAHLAIRQAAANGNAERLRGQVEGFRARGLSTRDMVRELNAVGIKSSTGGLWHYTQLRRVLARLGRASKCA